MSRLIAGIALALAIAAIGLHLHSQSVAVGGVPLQVRLLAGSDVDSPLEALATAPADTNRIVPGAARIWMRLSGLRSNADAGFNRIVFPALSVRDGAVWLLAPDAQGAMHLEAAVPLPIRNERMGAVVELGERRIAADAGMLVSMVPKLPRKIEAIQQSDVQYADSSARFERYGGALAGSFLALALFAAIVGTLNRDALFILFAGWLLTTYRLAAVNAGWDIAWMTGIDAGNATGQFLLRLTFAMHGVLTIALFRGIFAGGLAQRTQQALLLTQIAFLALMPFSLLLNHKEYFQIGWALGALTLCLQMFALSRASGAAHTQSQRVAVAAWVVNISGSILQIVHTSDLISVKVPLLNSQTAAVASGFLIAISLAERLRTERAARIAAQRDAVAALERFKATYEGVPIGLFSIDERGRVTQHNPAFQRILSVPAGAVGTWTDWFSVESLAELLAALETQPQAEIDVGHASEARWFRIHAHKKGSEIEASIEDTTARRLLREKLQREADHDSLTDLLNRRGIEAALDAAMSRCDGDRLVAVAFMDLDRFKLINDMFGHYSGDLVLKEIATRLVRHLPAGTLIARLGGDEFLILFEDVAAGEAARACDDCLGVINEDAFDIQDKQFYVQVTIGLIEVQSRVDVASAISAADRACGEAKKLGGSRLVAYDRDSSLLRDHVSELQMVARMHASLPLERMQMVVQPIVSLQAPFASLSYESLLRVRDEQGRLGPPQQLISAAERHGFISNIDRWVLNTLLDWLDAHPEHRSALNYCAINISGASLNDERFIRDVFAIAQEHPLSMQRICFEITETVALLDLSTTQRFISRVREFGSKVALDDFGAGYTSFNYLKELKADLVKIDGSFVKTIDVDRSNYAITRTIVDLTREVNMSCVAEWVETPQIVGMLAEMGVDYGQGWALSRPLSLDQILKYQNGGQIVTDEAVLAQLRGDREPPLRLRGAAESVRSADQIRGR